MNEKISATGGQAEEPQAVNIALKIAIDAVESSIMRGHRTLRALTGEVLQEPQQETPVTTHGKALYLSRRVGYLHDLVRTIENTTTLRGENTPPTSAPLYDPNFGGLRAG